MQTEREFKTFGPIDPAMHYHIDRTAVKSELRQKISKGRYIILDASPQTGKTTIFQEIIAELETDNEYFSILLDIRPLAADTQTVFYQKLALMLAEWRAIHAPDSPEVAPMHHQNDFARWLCRPSRILDKKCLLIIEGFEELSSEIAIPLLAQFRALYHQRYAPNASVPHSILMAGVQTEHTLLDGAQSPFNIADRFTVPYFTEDEVKTLLRQHTAATSQAIDEDVFKFIYAQTQGQPFLVNRLGQMLIDEVGMDSSQPITRSHLDSALLRLAAEENPHFSMIRSKAALYQSKIVDIVLNPYRHYNLQNDEVQELLTYGIMRTVIHDQNVSHARIANPIYEKVLFKAFVAPTMGLFLEDIPPHLVDDMSALEYLNDTALAKVACHTLSYEKVQKFDELLAYQGMRALSDSEQKTLDALIQEYDIMLIARAQAALLLKFRGYDVFDPAIFNSRNGQPPAIYQQLLHTVQ